MGTHKTPVVKKRAKKQTHGAAHGSKRPDSGPSHSPAEPPPVAKPMLDLTKERTLSVKEASYRLGMSEDGIRKMLQRGALKGWQIGGRFCRILVSQNSVLEVLTIGTRRFGG